MTIAESDCAVSYDKINNIVTFFGKSVYYKISKSSCLRVKELIEKLSENPDYIIGVNSTPGFTYYYIDKKEN